MNDLADQVIEELKTLPDKAFLGKWKYDTYRRIEKYIDDRRRQAMKPIEERQARSAKKSLQREKELEAKILQHFKSGYLAITPGMRVKFKGTRDDGYRKVHDVIGEQIIGFQFYYHRPWPPRDKESRLLPLKIIDQTTTTSNHITNLRQVLVSGKWKKIRDIINEDWKEKRSS